LNEIQDIKSKYGQQSESIIKNGLRLQEKNNKCRCPNTSAHKHGDKNPSMSWDRNLLQFHCFTCGLNIDLYGYYKNHLNYTHQEILRELLTEVDYKKTSMETKRNEFDSCISDINSITQECIDYIKLRSITEDTIKYFGLKSYKGNIAFPYTRYETITGYKLRKPIKNPGQPKMTSIPGSKPYLFNSQNVDMADELIICEGEFDCMVIHQCGYENVVSVGAGANSLSVLIEQAKDFINSFTYIIVVSDNDESGKNMDMFFVNEFKEKVKLINKELYHGNDINEELVLQGKQAVINIIESGRFKIEGRRDLDQVPYKGIKVLDVVKSLIKKKLIEKKIRRIKGSKSNKSNLYCVLSAEKASACGAPASACGAPKVVHPVHPKKTYNKKTYRKKEKPQYANFEQREYSEEYYEKFYENLKDSEPN
jgi:5S rRNA maturation endonuclease (ribonuclease M5)